LTICKLTTHNQAINIILLLFNFTQTKNINKAVPYLCSQLAVVAVFIFIVDDGVFKACHGNDK
jgi:hypothetical protein